MEAVAAAVTGLVVYDYGGVVELNVGAGHVEKEPASMVAITVENDNHLLKNRILINIQYSVRHPKRMEKSLDGWC